MSSSTKPLSNLETASLWSIEIMRYTRSMRSHWFLHSLRWLVGFYCARSSVSRRQHRNAAKGKKEKNVVHMCAAFFFDCSFFPPHIPFHWQFFSSFLYFLIHLVSIYGHPLIHSPPATKKESFSLRRLVITCFFLRGKRKKVKMAK
jgi:hypothetical protein